MLRCAITGGTASGFVNRVDIDHMEARVHRWAAAAIDFIQLREKSVEPGALLVLAEAARRTLAELRSPTKLLVNARVDVAIAARADGVHLTGDPDELTAQQVRAVYEQAGLAAPVVSVSCHTMDEINRARDSGVDLILFGPVFEKRVGDQVAASGVGLDTLAEACRAAGPVPVLGVGGVTPENAVACMAEGAAGIAGIRMFG